MLCVAVMLCILLDYNLFKLGLDALRLGKIQRILLKYTIKIFRIYFIQNIDGLFSNIRSVYTELDVPQFNNKNLFNVFFVADWHNTCADFPEAML